jgi:hypothetical protein
VLIKARTGREPPAGFLLRRRNDSVFEWSQVSEDGVKVRRRLAFEQRVKQFVRFLESHQGVSDTLLLLDGIGVLAAPKR